MTEEGPRYEKPARPPGLAGESSQTSSLGSREYFNSNIEKKSETSVIIKIIAAGFIMLFAAELVFAIGSAIEGPNISDYDSIDVYNDDLREYEQLMNMISSFDYFLSNSGTIFIVGGLVCLTFQSDIFEMPNSIRMVLLIGTLYMLANLLGFQMPFLSSAIQLGISG